ncbi:hypothetical protein BC937DRAFT_89086 [Endogone sp. FLAS-F59071]|nr:hypothetical protein BC937DRAFT_89086 [Endogone sp. FLAS-F59071]|eukprot:RUS22451.1 hypothetical protein BC937DRAFT_89086 [Endogone sp. FLAS-F59071]
MLPNFIDHTMPSDIARPFLPMFNLHVSSIIDNVQEVKSTALEIVVQNNLPLDIPFDNIKVQLVGTDPEVLWFLIEEQILKPGVNILRLESEYSTSGNYVVEAYHMTIGKLIFNHTYLNDNQKRRVFRLNHDPQFMKVSIAQPENVSLGEHQKFSVQVSTGRNSVIEGSLSITALTDGLLLPILSSLPCTVKSVDEDSGLIVESGRKEDLLVFPDGTITLPSCKEKEIIQFLIPYEGPWGLSDYMVKVVAEYITTDSKRRIFHSAENVKISMPLTVTESTIFREDCVFLKVELACNGLLPVRILGSNLRPSKIYDVANHPLIEDWDLTLFPKQLATFVYKLTKRTQQSEDNDLNSKVQFVVKYRSLKDGMHDFGYLIM